MRQVDELHDRPEGTARRRFSENRDRFIEGEDFMKVSSSEFRTRYPKAVPRRATSDMTVLTETGYLMLTKSFSDEFSWQVQRALVRVYFRAQELTASPLPAPAPKIELDAMEYQQWQADYWRTKYELERLNREKAETEKKRRRAFTEGEKTIMLAMNARGKTTGQIAAELGRTASSVRTWLRTRT
jgi:hypothetical protein